ncbi:MAG TPA: hypothetical protein VFR21_04205 [Bradyrhizobium sp.]|nr:hypothetical protein [Bradyrhizobium sp.]
MRFNKGGLIACAAYALHFALFFGWALFALFADLKASAVLAAIAVFPAGLFWAGIAMLFRLNDFPFPIDSWMNSIPVYFVESLIILYFIGWSASARTAASKLQRDARRR